MMIVGQKVRCQIYKYQGLEKKVRLEKMARNYTKGKDILEIITVKIKTEDPQEETGNNPQQETDFKCHHTSNELQGEHM